MAALVSNTSRRKAALAAVLWRALILIRRMRTPFVPALSPGRGCKASFPQKLLVVPTHLHKMVEGVTGGDPSSGSGSCFAQARNKTRFVENIVAWKQHFVLTETTRPRFSNGALL